jgi:hypothetical protein
MLMEKGPFYWSKSCPNTTMVEISVGVVVEVDSLLLHDAFATNGESRKGRWVKLPRGPKKYGWW